MIDSGEKLEQWLRGRPPEYAQVIAARVALRVMPYAFTKRVIAIRTPFHALALFRATVISWGARNFTAHDMLKAANAASYAVSVAYAQSFAEAFAADASFDATNAIAIAVDAAKAAANAARNNSGAAHIHAGHYATWENISADCHWLAESNDDANAARLLTREPLWLRTSAYIWPSQKNDAVNHLLILDPTYKVWTDWYDRRIIGNDAAFDIPGDTDRTEDKKILAALADATNEEFWDKGATYVNTTLQRWIDEARARVSALPEQDPAAITYGVNDRGQLDRLPASDQKHLRDVPDQQFLYGRIREAAFDLLGEGQRLGVPLSRALNRFAVAMPEDFATALALPIWAEGIILRRLYRAHRIAFESKELSSDQLEPVVAEGLGGLLDLYNHFAFGDDGLRAKDETTIPPQERASAEAEAAAAAPLAAAMLETPEVATDIVIDDITSEVDAQLDGGPYDDQARDHTNRNWRNRVAAILTGLRKTVIVAGKETAKGALSGAIAMGLTDAATGTHTLAALGKFVATNAQDFITYVSTAFPTYNLGWLIEKIARLFG